MASSIEQSITDPSLYREPCKAFHCSERLDKGSVVFVNTPPPSSNLNTDNLEFLCRKRSVGVLLKDKEGKVDSKEDEEELFQQMDPNFFDQGYTLAGATGFQIWAGTRLLTEVLCWPPSTTSAVLSSGSKVLELGAGIGVLGTNLAAMGCHVLMTDLATLVENATYPNLVRNYFSTTIDSAEGGPQIPVDDDSCKSLSSIPPQPDCPEWLQSAGGVPIGNGWAACTTLDWTIPVGNQLKPHQHQQLDFIVASDCVWLVSMLNALLDTVASCWASVKGVHVPPLILSFQRRDTSEGDDSPNFTTVGRVLRSIQERGWAYQCLAWRNVAVESEQHDSGVEEKEVFVFLVKPKVD